MKAEQLSFATPDIYTELRIDREKKRRSGDGKTISRSGRMSSHGTELSLMVAVVQVGFAIIARTILTADHAFGH